VGLCQRRRRKCKPCLKRRLETNGEGQPAMSLSKRALGDTSRRGDLLPWDCTLCPAANLRRSGDMKWGPMCICQTRPLHPCRPGQSTQSNSYSMQVTPSFPTIGGSGVLPMFFRVLLHLWTRYNKRIYFVDSISQEPEERKRRRIARGAYLGGKQVPDRDSAGWHPPAPWPFSNSFSPRQSYYAMPPQFTYVIGKSGCPIFHLIPTNDAP
jgi:hypothetical protein